MWNFFSTEKCNTNSALYENGLSKRKFFKQLAMLMESGDTKQYFKYQKSLPEILRQVTDELLVDVNSHLHKPRCFQQPIYQTNIVYLERVQFQTGWANFDSCISSRYC